jgi:hypothetical protein
MLYCGWDFTFKPARPSTITERFNAGTLSEAVEES